MFYRPNYCCHCGEKIARAKWTPLTSRRFCDFCEIEQKQHDLFPRVVIVVAVLFGAAGLTSYVGSSGNADVPPGKRAAHTREPDRGKTNNPIANRLVANTDTSNPAQSALNGEAALKAAPANVKQRDIRQNSSTEPVYYCGAMTKKGTPCTRRVKTVGRCWQHGGRPGGQQLN